MNELKEAAKQFYNLTMADATVIIRPPNAQKQAAIVAAGQSLVAALALPDAEPVTWRWDIVDVSIHSKRKGAKFGFYTETPASYGIPIPHPSYKWTPLYDGPQPAIAPVFLNNGRRYKINSNNLNEGQIHGILPELIGKWVALVAADDDCHLQPAPLSLSDVGYIAERHSKSFTNPLHFVMSVGGLQAAFADMDKQRRQT